MKNKNYFFKAQGLQLSFFICCIVNVIFTIVKERNEQLKIVLKETFGNAWFGQMVIMLLLFILLVLASRLFKNSRTIRFAIALPVVLIVSILVLFIFYIKN